MRKSKRIRKEEKRIRIHNRKLCKKYPFLKPWKGWKKDRYGNYHEIYGWRHGEKYSYIMWDFWPWGWNKTFGKMMLEEIGEVVKNSRLTNFHILDGKEKWGRMVLDCYPYTEEIDRVIAKYEVISQNVCTCCGHPDVWQINTGWILPLCFNCYKMIQTFNVKYPESDVDLRLKYDKYRCSDSALIPDTYTIHSGNNKVEIDIKSTVEKIRARWR